jgi:O-antigen ligase
MVFTQHLFEIKPIKESRFMSNFGFKTERIVRQLLLMAIFCVSFSTTLTNFFVACTYLSFFVALCMDRKLMETLKFTPSALALGLFVLFLLGATWSIAPRDEILHAIGKYSKLFLIPLGVALSWRDSTLARRAIVSFMAGAAVLALSSYLVRFDMMPFSGLGWWKVGDATNAFAFKNHITIGFILGFSSLICWNYFSYASSLPTRLLSIGSGIYFAVPVIFLTLGRTGYVVLFIGVVTLCVLHFRSSWKMLVVSMLAATTMFVGFYSVSDNFRQRSSHLISEIKDYSSSNQMHLSGTRFADSGEVNSSGIRLSFYKAGLQMIAQHPMFGLGTGSFSEGFAPTAKKLWPENSPESTIRYQPHSEVILIGVQLGVVGLIMYLSLLGSLIEVARKSRSFEATSLSILVIIFGTAAIFNSLLWDVTEGYWFVFLAGCLYAQVRRQRADTVRD